MSNENEQPLSPASPRQSRLGKASVVLGLIVPAIMVLYGCVFPFAMLSLGEHGDSVTGHLLGELATRRSMRETKIKQHIDDIGREAFPDSPNVVWSIREIIHKEEDVAFAEVEPKPSDPIGWTRLKFALHFASNEKPTLAACYGFSDGLWSSVFHVTGYDSSEFDRLLSQGSGQPMPVPEREASIREHIDGIAKDAFADYPAVSWTLEGVIHKGWYTFVEAKPSPADPIGWSRCKFVLRCEADG